METPEWPYPVQTNAGSPESQTLVSGLQNQHSPKGTNHVMSTLSRGAFGLLC